MPRAEAREGILRIDRSQRPVNPSRKIRIKKPHPEGWDNFTQIPVIRAAQLISRTSVCNCIGQTHLSPRFHRLHEQYRVLHAP